MTEIPLYCFVFSSSSFFFFCTVLVGEESFGILLSVHLSRPLCRTPLRAAALPAKSAIFRAAGAVSISTGTKFISTIDSFKHLY